MIRYVFNDGPVTIKNAGKADPQTIGDALAAILQAHDGRLVPGDVVTAAKDPAHPLHRHFEWDDKTAALAYRIDQAREIIRIVRIESEEGEEPQRAFLSIADRGGTAYRELAEIKGSAELQLRLMEQAARDLRVFRNRYRSLADICEAIEVIEDKLRARTAPAAEAA